MIVLGAPFELLEWTDQIISGKTRELTTQNS
jgi:hypothetical protein